MVAADVEPEKVAPLIEVRDPGLRIVEGQAPGRQPLGQPSLDLLRLLLAVTQRNKVIGVPDHRWMAGLDLSGAHAGGQVSDSSGRFQPVQRDVEQQRTDHAALGDSLIGWRESLARLEHAGFQPRPDHVPGWEPSECVQKSAVVDSVERRGQVRIQHPHPLGLGAFAGQVDRLDRVLATTAWPKPVASGLEPGLPLRLQRVTNPALMAPIRYHWNPEGA